MTSTNYKYKQILLISRDYLFGLYFLQLYAKCILLGKNINQYSSDTGVRVVNKMIFGFLYFYKLQFVRERIISVSDCMRNAEQIPYAIMYRLKFSHLRSGVG